MRRFKIIKHIKKLRVRTLISLGLISILLPIIAFVLFKPSGAVAGWFNDNFTYRQRFEFTHNATVSEPRAITVTLDTAELITAGVMQSDCDDTRFTNSSGEELEYDLTGTCNNASTTYEVIFPTVLNGTQYGYVYYGNPSAYNKEIDSTIYTALTPSGGDPSAITTRTNEETGPGPLLYYRFDEGADNTCPGGTADACNSSSNAYHLTIQSTSPSRETGVKNEALRFVTGGGYLSNGSETIDYTGDITMQAWVKLDGTGSSEDIIGFSGYNPTWGYVLNINSDGTIRFRFQDSGSTWRASTSDAFFNDSSRVNKWYHIAATHDGSNTRFYINGSLFDTVANAYYPGSSDNTIQLGYAGSVIMDGLIDEVKVYPYARSASEVKQDFLAGAASSGSGVVLGESDQSFINDGLVGYWPMDESSGTAVADESGNNNDGTLTNAQEAGTSDGSGNSTTTLVDTNGTLSSTNDAYNGMVLYITDDGTCPLSANDHRLITDYVGSTKTFTVGSAFSAAVNSCQYTVRHQAGGKFSNAGNFDGIDDYIETGVDSAFDIGTTLTVSAWFKRESNSTVYESIVNHIKKSAGFDGYWIGSVNDGRIRAFVGPYNTNAVDTTDVVSNNVWHHVALVSNGTTFAIYIDGVKASADQSVGAITTTDVTVRIGRSIDVAQYFDGLIDEVRIYNREFSPAEVEALYKWAPGPAGYWPFEEGSGTTTIDRSGNGNTGTLSGPQILPEWISGRYGSGLYFGGDPDGAGGQNGAYVSLVGNSALHPSFALTIGAWVKKDIGTSDTIFRGQATEAILDFDTATSVRFGVNQYQDSISATGDYPDDGNWHYVAGTYDGSQLSIYIDGNLVQTGAYSQIIKSTTNAQHIGARNDLYADYFVGSIDEVRFYNYARTQEQILEDMVGSTIQVAGTRLPTPVAHWKFDELSGQIANAASATSSLEGTLGASSSSSTDDPTWIESSSCKINGCLSFDGGDHIDIGDVTELEFGTRDFSFTGWLNLTSAASNQRIIGKGSYGLGGYTLWIESGGDLALNTYDSSSTNFQTTSNPFASLTGTWAHFAVSIDRNGTSRIFINGKELATTGSVKTGSLTDTSYSFQVAETSNSLSHLTGYLDEIKVYNLALSAEQVSQDYNAGSTVNFGAGSSSEKSTITGGAGNAPLAYWDFDDGSGSTLTDKSGNGNDADLSNMDIPEDWIAGKNGSALEFDGSDTYAFVSDSSALNTGSDFTISTWVRSTATGTLQTFASMGSEFNWLYNLYFHSDNSLNCKIYQNNSGSQYLQAVSSTSYRDSQWHQVTCSVSGTQVDLYVDGQLVATDSTPTGTRDTTTTGTFNLGRFNYSTPYNFNGTIDETKVWDYALSSSQIAYEFNRGKPVAEWKFEECQGTTLNDATGNGNNGTLTIGATGSNTSVGTCTSGTSTEAWNNGSSGKNGAAMSFDGTDDYISIADDSILDTESNFSVAGWINLSSSASGSNTIYSSGNGDTNYWYLRINADGSPTVDFFEDGGSGFSSIKQITTDEWHHIVVTKNTDSGSNVSIYIDGVLGNQTSVGSHSITGTKYIGARNDGGGTIDLFEGQIDEFKIYNYPLSLSQIRNLYNGGAIRFQ